MKSLIVTDFLSGLINGVLIDVRTPAEFEKGHIPGAKNLPLFSDEERVVVGTIYKQIGRQPAILKGLEITGPKMKEFVKQAESLSGSSNKLFLYCWRGGMRSGSVAWLLNMYGFEVYTLKRGYKAFRNYVLQSFHHKKDVLILGGKTGSGKTIILHELAKSGQQVLDLEGLAHHKGSAFGTIGESESCSQEHFENKLAMEWIKMDPQKSVWLEDESRSIGKKIIPESVWNQMREAHVINLDMPFETRLQHVMKIYGEFPVPELIASVEKIQKRLGGLAYKQVMEYLNNDVLYEAAGILLIYYDKTYLHGLKSRNTETISTYLTEEKDFAKIAKELVKFAANIKSKIN